MPDKEPWCLSVYIIHVEINQGGVSIDPLDAIDIPLIKDHLFIHMEMTKMYKWDITNPQFHDTVISRIEKEGSDKDKDILRSLSDRNQRFGIYTPIMFLTRLSSVLTQESTPTIIKKWKDDMKPDVAVWFFDSCDIYAMNSASSADDSKTKYGYQIDKRVIATCYVYLTHESSDYSAWNQGKEIFESMSDAEKIKCTDAVEILQSLNTTGITAEVLQTLNSSAIINEEDSRILEWCRNIAKKGTPTSELGAPSYAGKGRSRLLG